MNIKMSVKKQVLTILILSIIVTCTLSFVMFKVTLDASTETIVRQNFGLSKIFCAGVENELHSMKNSIINFISSDASQMDFDALSKGLNSYEGHSASRNINSRLISESIIGDSITGMCYYSNPGNCFRFSVSQEDISFLKYDFIESELSESNYKLVHFSDKPYVYLLTKNEGYFVFLIDISRVMHKAYSIYGTQFDSCFTIVSNGKIIYSEDEALSEIALSVSEQTEHKSGVQWITRDSKRYVVNYVSSAYTDWKYLYVLPTELVYGEINHIITFSATIFVLSLIVLFIVAYLLTEKITKRLSSLRKYMKDTENGVYIQHPYLKKTNDDLDELLVSYNNMVSEIQRLVEVDHKKEIILNQTRFQALKAQINPHFIYNTLETIKCLAIEKQTECVENVIDKLGDLLRATINMPDQITLRQELEVIESYLYIQKIRFGDRLVFTSDIDKKYCNILIPHLILQPLIENSIKHVMEVVADPNHIHLAIQEENGLLALSVTDSGKGFVKKSSESQNGGIGLENISDRLNLYFGERAELKISVNSHGNTCVKILIPIDQENI